MSLAVLEERAAPGGNAGSSGILIEDKIFIASLNTGFYGIPGPFGC
jgi:hypothetical protein